MISVHFINGNPSNQERESIKENWLKNLNEFRQEFEDKASSLTFNLTANPESDQYAEFGFINDMERADFIQRFRTVYPPKET